MNSTIDKLLSTQLCTVMAGALTYIAHLIEAGHILNENWQVTVIPLLCIACASMVLPYIICSDVEPEKVPKADVVKSMLDSPVYRDRVEIIDQKPVRPYGDQT